MRRFGKILVVAGCGAVVLALGLPPRPIAQAEATETTTTPSYAPPVGSRWTILSEGREEKTQDGKSTETIIFNRKEELTIVAKTADGFRISTVLRDYDMHGNVAQEMAMKALLGALRDVVVRAVVDQAGKPQRIENLDEVVAAHKEGFERMLASFKDKPEQQSKIRDLLDPLLTRTAQDPDQAAQWYLETVAQLAIAQNTGLAPGQEQRSSKPTPNPFGGEPIKTNTTLSLAEADPAGGKVKVVRTQAYDPEAMKAFTIALAKKIVSGNSLAELEKVMKEVSLSMDDRTEYIVEDGMTRSSTEDSAMHLAAMGHTLAKHEHNQITVTPLP